MRALDRKLLRDLRRTWSQGLAIAAVVAAGVGVCVSMLSALASLQESRDEYYARARLADVFATATRAPNVTAKRLRDIAGVEVVETRVVVDVTLDVPGLSDPAVGRLVSIPDDNPPVLNQLTLRAGGYPAPTSDDEVLASEAFTLANHLGLGSEVGAVINGHWRRLTIVGTVLSPEYVYSIRAGDLFPDDRRFGVFWMRRRALAAATDLDGAFNDVALDISAEARVEDVRLAVDSVLGRYGGIGAYARKDQTSAWYVENELSQLSNMGRVTPLIFAGVAAFLLNVVMSRLVATQRTQIGVLKAFGYSPRAFTVHYLAFVLTIVAIGSAMGIGIGAWTGYAWTRMYADFFRFPALTFILPVPVAIAATAGAVVIGIVATVGAVWRATAVPPAEAMRPPSPASYRRGLIDRAGLQRLVPLTGRIVARNVARRPLRAFLTVVAIALSVAIVIVAIFTVDSIHYLTQVQFNAAERQDVTVTFVQPQGRRALYELARQPGVIRAEPFRMVGVRARAANHSRRVALIGYATEATLARLIDQSLRPLTLPAAGLVLNDALAGALDVRAGDTVHVEILEGARRTETLPVVGVVPQYLGLAAYMDIAALNRLVGEGTLVSGAYLHTDSDRAAALYASLKRMPDVAGVTISNAAQKSFEETLATVVNTVTMMFLLFGATIAFAVIYNSSRIAFAERARELGTLHVLGYSHREMGAILLGEIGLLTGVALPIGVLLGRLLAAAVVVLFATELARIPLVISSATIALAIGVTLASATVSAAATWRQLVRLDVLGVLKAPE